MFLRQESFHPTLCLASVYDSFFLQEIQLETISFREGHPLIHFMFYRDHGHGNQSVVKWAFLKYFRAKSKNFSKGLAPDPDHASVRFYPGSAPGPVCLTVLAAKSEDCTTAPKQHYPNHK